MSLEGQRLIREGLESPKEPQRAAEATVEATVAIVKGFTPFGQSKAFVRAVRRSYVHTTCPVGGTQITSLSESMAASFARDPGFFAATLCAACGETRPVSEFVWDGDGETVGS